MQVKHLNARATVRQAIRAGLFTSAGIVGLLAGASALRAEPGVCETTGDLTLFACDTSIAARAESGETSLTVTGANLTDGNINYNPNSAANGPLDMTLTVTNSVVNSTDYGGLNIYSGNNDGTNVQVTLGEDVSITSSAGYGGIWVRNEIAGDIDITSGANLTVSGTETGGISATTNAGSVHIGNSGDITVLETPNAADFTQRGIYADGGFGNTEPGEVTVTNSGAVNAQAAGIRTVNYNGLSKIENSGTVTSVNNQALIAWTPNGEVVIVNNAQGDVSAQSGPAIQGASQIGDITVTNQGQATGTVGITAIAGFDEQEPGSGAISITNSGTVTATAGTGVYARTPEGDVTLINSGQLSSTASGLDLDSANGTVAITNSGTIGGIDGIVTNAAATTIVNSGTISGTDGGAAIVMGSGDVTLELHAGTIIEGLVSDSARESGTNALVLGGGTDASFDAGSIGAQAQYRDFETFAKTGESNWTLTGEGSTGWTVEEGTLTAGSDTAFGVDQAYVVNGGIVDGGSHSVSLGSLNGSEGGTVATSGTVTITEDATSSYAGAFSGTGTIEMAGAGTLSLTGTSADFSGTLAITNGTTQITGAQTAAQVTVGGAESAQLNILAGGSLESDTASIGMNGTTGSVTITGAGAEWVNGGGIQIGRDPGSSGSLTITEGGAFETVQGGLYMGAGGAITVSGEGSALRIGTLHPELPADWVSADGWFSADEGSITITDGGLLDADGSYIGGGGEGTATMVISGTETVWSNGLSLYIGGTGNGMIGHGDVTVSGGATVTSYTSALGVDTGSAGTLTLTGEGTTYTVLARDGFAGNMRVGYSGTGTATVSDGALLAATALIDVASQEGSSGTLIIENGGQVTGESMRIGGAETAVGSVSVDGTGSTLQIGSGRIGVGVSGEGTLMVSNGGSASSDGAIIGWEATGKGTATVTGAGSEWTNDGILYVGNIGEGTLNIAEGGRVTSTDGYVGTVAGSKGTVDISGADSIWDMSGLFIAGNEADAESTITISDGGTLRAVQGTLGNLAGSNATMTVTGAGSTWNAYDDGVTAWAGFMNVGLFGSGTLNVTDGGTVEAVRLYVGNDVGSIGSVLLSGEGSTVRTQQGLYIGAEGAGTLTLTDGAHIEAEAIKVGYLSGSTGTLNIGAAAGETAAAAGTIDTGEIVLGSGESQMVLNHIHNDYEIAANFTGTGDVDVLAGTTLLSGDNSAFAGGFSIEGGKLILASATNAVSTAIGTEGTLQIGNGGTSGSLNGDIVSNGSLVFDRSDALHHNRVISGTGDLTIAGGIITLSGMNTFTGATTIDGGAALALSSQGRVNQSSLVTVNGTFDVTEGSAPRINDIAGSGTVLLGDSGLQIDNASHVFSGQITGSGGLYVNAGTLTLTGENDFASGLGIGDATVRIGDGGTTGSITASTLNYGTLIFDRSNEWTYAGAITGRGEIVHTGSGTTNLTGGLSGNHLIVENGTVNQIGGLVALFGEGAGIVVEGEDSQLNVTNVGARATNTVYLVRDGGSLAINGGSIRVGSSAESAGVHLQSGNASVIGTTFTVGGANTYGVVVDAGNTLTVADSTITTTGQAAIGALARNGGALAISGTTIETEGTDAYAAYASNGGTITLANSTITTSGLVADALASDGDGSLISATDTTVETTGIQTAAVVARNSGAVDLTGGSVSATVNADNPAAVWALLAKDGGSISATNIDLSLTMLDSSPYVTGVAYAMDEGSSITINGGTATATGKRANGIFAYNSGSVSAQGLTISTSGEQARGVYANADSNAASSVTLTDVTIGASGTSAHGLFAKRDGGSTGSQIATITGENIALTVEGDQANGVYAAVGGIITLNGGSVSTSGLEGHALHAQQFDGGMTGGGVITASGLTVNTSGASAFGGLAEAGGLLSLTDSSVTTSGEGSYGLYARTNGALVVSNASIVSGAIGVGIANAGSIDMTGGDIESAGASLEASTSDDATATFRFSGTDLTKNNGTLLAVAHQSDGDGSGAASLSLLDGSAAKGSIIGIGDGQLDVLVSESSLEGAISNVSRLTLDDALWTVTALQGLGELNIASGSTTISTATTITHDGALTGSGTLIKSGTGRFALAGDGGDFAGTTRIDAGSVLLTGSLDGAVTINAQGTMIVGDGVTNGDLTASTINDGTLIFNQIGDYDYTGALTGNGGLVKQGSGTLLLSGDYGYTGSTIVEAGKVRLLAELDSDTDLVVNDGEFDLSGTDQTVAGLSGTGGTVSIGSSTLTVNQGASTTFGGVFTGGGQIVLQSPVFDPGAPVIFHLTGASVDFTGGIDLHSVQVRVNGSMGGSIFVGNNAALGGSGQTNDIVVGSGGTLLPGNSIGTLTAEGNVIFEAGSTYEVEVNAKGESDKLLVGGTATIEGGTVSVLAAAGNYRFTSDYVIISAEGGVTGTFDDTDVDLPFLTPYLRYDANDVVLTLQRNDRSFESVAVTPNQIAVARALDASDQEASLPRAVAGQIEEAGAVRAFDALSGELWATTGTLMIDGTRRMGEMVTGRLEQADIVSRALANSGTSARTLRDGSTAVWGQGIGSWSTLKSNGNAIKATQSTFGFITGIDTMLGDWRLGVAFSHGQDKIRVDGRSSEATVNSNSIAAYAGGGWGALRARVGASYSWLDVNGTRKVVFPGVNDALAGDYNAKSASAFGELSYALSLGAATVEPFAGVNHVHLKSDDFTETGSTVTALGVEDSTRNVTYTTLGLRLGGAIPISATSVLTPRVSAAWLRSFGDVDATSRHTLSTGEAFSVAGLPTTRDTLRLEGGLQANIMPGGSIGATYVGNIGDQWKDHGVKLGFSYSF